MEITPKAKKVISTFDSLKNQRDTWENHWQDVADYMLPRKADITETRTRGDKRHDQIYDIIVVIGYNVDPVVPYKGSAIFMHLTSGNYLPTEGCIALKRETMLEMLSKAAPGAGIEISENL